MHQKIKLRLRNTIIDKTLTYASETRTLTETEGSRKFLNAKFIEEFWGQYVTMVKNIGGY